PLRISERRAQAVAPVRASVIIPTYNAARSLARTLQSLAAVRTPALAEVIVCDDGSSDSTPAVSRDFMPRLPLQYRRQEDVGFRAAAARNLGVRRATGDVLIFIDSDVMLPDGF